MAHMPKKAGVALIMYFLPRRPNVLILFFLPTIPYSRGIIAV
jgi:hypothetical protein